MPDPHKELEAFLKLYPSLADQLEVTKKQACKYRDKYCKMVSRSGSEYESLKKEHQFVWEVDK